MTTPARRLVLIDLSAIFWWKWHAAAGQPVDTAFEFCVGKVHTLAHGEELVAVCCDGVRSFRYQIDPAYKGTRPPRAPEAVAQLARVKQTLAEQGFLLWEQTDLEADDLIATAVKWASAQDPLLEVLIAGSDKDLLQLVGGHGVTMLGLQTGDTIGPDAVRAKFGVHPHQMRDYLALVGDSSDNVKGVPKVGPKHAARLLAQFGSIEALCRNLDATDDNGEHLVQPESIRLSLLSSLGVVDLAVRLVTLRSDATIDVGPLLDVLHGRPKAPPPAEEPATAPAALEAPPPTPAPKETAPVPDPTPAPVPAAAAPAPAPLPLPLAGSARFSAAAVTRAPDRSAHKFVFTGRSGIGKTFFCSTIPRVFMLPIEEGLKGTSPDHEPAHFDGPPPKTLDELHQALDGFTALNAEEGGQRPYLHLVLDSLTGVESLIHRAACGAERVQHMEAKEYKKVWSAAEPLWVAVQAKLDRIRRSGVHVWLIAHSAEVVDAASDTGETFRKWDLALKGPGKTGEEVRTMWRAWADHVFFLDWVTEVRKGSKTARSVGKYKARVLHTRESATHYAKTRSRLPETLPATWEDLARAMKRGVSAPDEKLRAELAAILPRLADDDRAELAAGVEGATGTKLAALVSRAQGMLAIATEDLPETADDPAAAE